MKFKVVWEKFYMILRHFEIFEKSTKNDPKMIKVGSQDYYFSISVKSSEFIVIENSKIPDML